MLKVFGNMYSGSKEDLNAIVSALENDGFEIAYVSDLNVTIIKNVDSLTAINEVSEN